MDAERHASQCNSIDGAIDLRINFQQTRDAEPADNGGSSTTASSSKFGMRKRRYINIFKKHKLRYRYLQNRQSKNTSDSGQFGSSSLMGSTSAGSHEKLSGNEPTSSPCTSSSPSPGLSQSPQTFPHIDIQSPNMCMMVGQPIPLVVMMRSQLQSTENSSNEMPYSDMLFKCNLCNMFSNNLTDVLSHVHINHSNVQYCFECNRFHNNKSEFDRHKDMCATAHQAFQQIIDGHYNGAGTSNTDGTGSQDQVLNLSVANKVAMRAAQIVHNKNGGRSKIKKLQKCTYCNKAFFGRFYLQRHLRSHTGEKLCHCTICGKGFAEWRNLRNHMSRFHNSSKSNSSGRQSKSGSSITASDSDQTGAMHKPCNSGRNNCSEPSSHPESANPPVALPQSPNTDENANKLTRSNSQPTSSLPATESNTNAGLSTSAARQNLTPDRGVRSQADTFPRSSSWGPQSCGYGYNYQPTYMNSTATYPRTDSPYSSSSSISMSATSVTSDCNGSSMPLYATNAGSSTTSAYGSGAASAEASRSESISNFSTETNEKSENQQQEPSRIITEEHKPVASYLGSTSSRLELSNGTQGHEQSLTSVCNENGEKVYQCSLCNRVFKTKFAMQRHINFHMDKRPFACTQCEYKAKTRPQLKVHVMRHTGEKGYSCRICNYSCVTHSDLNRHCKSRAHVFRMGYTGSKNDPGCEGPPAASTAAGTSQQE